MFLKNKKILKISIWFKDTLFELKKFYFIQINHVFKSKKVKQD